MLFDKIILPLIPFILLNISPLDSKAACDCRSTNSSAPCTGQEIFVSVIAGTPNGGKAVNSNYTWTFDSGGGDARCGQFANGDYWVAPAQGQSSVRINSITSNGAVSADVNPNLESMGLMDGTKNYGNYSSSENIIPLLPQSFSKATSIVAAVQRNEPIEGNCGTAGIVGQCIDSYNIVTILPSVPVDAGSKMIRPNITGESKIFITFSDLDLTRLSIKSFLTGTTADGLEAIRRRWSHSTEIFGLHSANNGTGYSEGGRAFRSHILIDDYGAGMTVSWYNDLMTLFSDAHTIDLKKPALAAMLAYGLDLYHSMYNTPPGIIRYWDTGATQHPGRFMPPVFLAALMKDNSYAETLKTVSSHLRDNNKIGPLELAQIHPGVNGPVWGDVPSLGGVNFQGAYWNDLFKSKCYDGASGTCNPVIGAKTMFDPYGYIDGPPNKPATSYMSSSLGVQKAMVAIMFLMPEICEIVNYDTLVEYIDRVMNYGVKTEGDPCVTPDSRETEDCDPYRNNGCIYYGKTWGPIIPTDKYSQCITKPTSPYNKVGRFVYLDGTKVGASYKTSQVESNWDIIRGTSATCRTAGQPVLPPTKPTGFKLIQ